MLNLVKPVVNNCVTRWYLNTVLDLLFGKEEDFDYVSTTSPRPLTNES